MKYKMKATLRDLPGQPAVEIEPGSVEQYALQAIDPLAEWHRSHVRMRMQQLVQELVSERNVRRRAVDALDSTEDDLQQLRADLRTWLLNELPGIRTSEADELLARFGLEPRTHTETVTLAIDFDPSEFSEAGIVGAVTTRLTSHGHRVNVRTATDGDLSTPDS